MVLGYFYYSKPPLQMKKIYIEEIRTVDKNRFLARSGKRWFMLDWDDYHPIESGGK